MCKKKVVVMAAFFFLVMNESVYTAHTALLKKAMAAHAHHKYANTFVESVDFPTHTCMVYDCVFIGFIMLEANGFQLN